MALALVVVVLAIGISPVMAAKPQPVITLSNGFPSGAHFNLNIHGKNPATFTPDPAEVGGGSVFVSLFGDSTVTLRSDKRSALTELSALDPFAEVFDGDPALVQIPYQADGYWVFARILGKPQNGKDGAPSSIILTPNTVPVVYNYPDDPTITDPLMALGYVTTDGAYKLEYQGFLRFDPNSAPGKGKSKAVDITGLFMWTGWVCDASLDSNGDKIIDVNDIPEADYDGDPLTPPNRDYNNDGVVNNVDLEAWLTAMAALDPPLAWHYVNEWIFNIADIVEQEQTVTNDGTKLLQIRFYPKATTEFVPAP